MTPRPHITAPIGLLQHASPFSPFTKSVMQFSYTRLTRAASLLVMVAFRYRSDIRCTAQFSQELLSKRVTSLTCADSLLLLLIISCFLPLFYQTSSCYTWRCGDSSIHFIPGGVSLFISQFYVRGYEVLDYSAALRNCTCYCT